MNKYKFFGVVNMIKTCEDIYHAIDEFIMEDDLCLASFAPHFSKINGATIARIDSIINIGDEKNLSLMNVIQFMFVSNLITRE